MQIPSSHGPGIALRDYGFAELSLAIEVLALRGGRRHAGLAQARQAIRRTRATLALAAAVLGRRGRRLDRQLRRVNRQLAPLRTAHALVQALERLDLKARDAASRTALQRAQRIAIRRRAALVRQPEFTEPVQRAQADLETLRATLRGLPWEALQMLQVIEAMTATERRAEAACQRAVAGDALEDWQRWRRRLRRVSQQHRALVAAGLPAPIGRFEQCLGEQLGVMQDLRVLSAHCGKDSPFAESRQALHRFAAWALARQRRLIRWVLALR